LAYKRLRDEADAGYSTAGTTAWCAIRGGLDMRYVSHLLFDSRLTDGTDVWQDGRTSRTLDRLMDIQTSGRKDRTHDGHRYTAFPPLLFPSSFSFHPSNTPHLDRIRPRRNHHLNLLVRLQTRLRKVSRRNTSHQLRRDAGLGDGSAQVDRGKGRRSRC
jgi:hypothetical protein